jgi:hypothetical protein
MEDIDPMRTRVAEDLGVVQQTVSRAIDELPESVKRTQLSKVNTAEKREQVREFIEDTPDTPGPSGTVFTGCTR